MEEKEVKLIDMEKVLSELCLSHKDIIYIDKNETAERIRKIPSIDIVRCKECKYFIDNLTEDDTDEAYDSCRWDWSRKIPTADDFCNYGERSE